MDLVTSVSPDAQGPCSIVIRILCVILVYTMGLSKRSKVLPKCENKYFQLRADKFC